MSDADELFLLEGESWCDHCGALMGPGANPCETLPEPPYETVTCSYTHPSGRKRRTTYPAPCLRKQTQ